MNNIKELINKLNIYTKYYDEGNPQISDKEWDDMYFKLKKIEEETGIIYPNSPTQNISYEVLSELKKKKHEYKPMLSLDKTKEIKELENFCFGHKDYCDWFAMFKMDGLSCRLTYSNGKLVGAETRGDGENGEWILHNAKVIKNIPQTIPHINEDIIIDGEIICRLDNFEKFKNEYKNPRNFAAGSIRLLDASECANRNLSFVAWDLIKGCENIDFNFHRLEQLDDWGFETVPRVGDAETIQNAIDILNKVPEHSIYPIDGYVFKFESKEFCEKLGQTEHHFNSAMAYKFYDEEYETTLKYITYDVSRNGVLTPVAVFEPVEIDGSTVERASLHNMSVMEDILGKTPYCGEFIWVYKANQIIPQISRANKQDYGDIISHGGVTTGLGGDYGILCPICEGLTSIHVSDSGVKVLMCDNPNCEGKLAQQIDHFFGIKGLNVKGISRKTIEKLIDWGWINGLRDIYELDRYRAEWISKTGFGENSVGKILSAIDASKKGCVLSAFISALGIPLVGRTIAKEIVKYYNTWEEFRAAVGGDWTEFEGFGPEISKAINNFDYTEADKIAELLTFSETSVEEVQSETAAGLTFCVTGKLKTYRNRDELKSYIESIGGKVVSSMSSKVQYLINNDATSTSAKNTAAKKAGIPILTEEDFISKFGSDQG